MARLIVIDGTERRTLDLEPPRMTCGRTPDCDVVLPGDETVSRQHAVLMCADGQWSVEDCGSRNGSWLNGVAVVGRAPLHPGDRLLVGSYVLVLDDSDEPAATTDASAAPGRRQLRQDTGLSPREIEILRLVCYGSSDAQIAETLFISVRTVQSHLDRIRDKTDCRRRPDLVRYGLDHGIA